MCRAGTECDPHLQPGLWGSPIPDNTLDLSSSAWGYTSGHRVAVQMTPTPSPPPHTQTHLCRTLGIVAATALASRGIRFAVLELPPHTHTSPHLCRTLGIIAATALAARGIRVAVLERGPLKGRDQEWNISRSELNSLTEVRLRVCLT